MPHSEKYKKKGSRYEDERFLRAARKEKERRESRHTIFASRRNIEEDILKPLAENLPSNVKGKKLQLLQWKQKKEKERQEALEKKNKKPPFVVGIVHHKMIPQFPSPVNSSKLNKSFKIDTSFATKLHQSLVKKSFAPIFHEFKAPSSVKPIVMIPAINKQNTDHSSNKRLKREPAQVCLSKGKLHSRTSVRSRPEEEPRRSTRLSSKIMKAPEDKHLGKKISQASSVLKNLSFIEESENEDKNLSHQEDSIKSGDQHVITEEEEKSDLQSNKIFYAASFSPYICRLRGKGQHESPPRKSETPIKRRESGGLRKQIAKKIIEEKLNNHTEIEEDEKCSKDNLFAPSPSDDQNITSFRKLYSDAMKRLGSLSLDWDTLLISQEIPTEIQDSVRSTVCQTRLLMREKLAQFKELVDRCASGAPSTQCKVTHSDLQGFWDLVSIQIEDINNKFKKLDDLKDNNWVEILKKESVRKQRIKVNKEPMKPKVPKVEKKSAFQLFLLEQRKKLEDAAKQQAVTILTPSNKFTICSPERRKSTRRSSARYKEGESSACGFCAVTPKRVTFKGLDEDSENPKIKLPATPHIKKVSCESSKASPTSMACTPTSTSKKKRSQRLPNVCFYSSDELSCESSKETPTSMACTPTSTSKKRRSQRLANVCFYSSDEG